jgi:iron complex outermembrane recepter protein
MTIGHAGVRIASRGWFRAHVSLLAAASALCAAGAAAAEDGVDPFSLAPEQLFDARVLSVSRSMQSVRDAPAAVYVITAEDIARSGVTSIPEALRLAPGVEVARTNASGWAISVRGFNGDLANKLLVLIDGREVYDPLFAGVYWDIQDTVLEDIDRIEVVRGPGASLWGSNAVNGVINIITKSAVDTQGWMLSALAGDEEGPTISARYGAAKSNMSWRMFGRYLSRKAFASLDGARPNTDETASRIGFRLDADPTAHDSLSLQGEVYHSESGDWRGAPQFTPPYTVIQSEDVVAWGGDVMGRWQRSGADGSQFSAQAYAQMTKRDQLTFTDKRATVDLDLQYDFAPMGPHNVTAGLGYRWTKDEAEITPYVTAVSPTIRGDRSSGFVQDRITLAPGRWELTLGSKFEDNEYSGFELQPNVRLQWMGDGQMAWAAISRALRTPSDLERQFNIVIGVAPPGVFPWPASIDLSPNPDFHSSKVIAYEAGYRRDLSANAQLDVALFYNSYDDLDTYEFGAIALIGDPLHLQIPLITRNDSRARSYGMETVLEWRARDNLRVLANYSFLDLDVEAPPPSVAINGEVAEGRSPRHQAQLRASWDINERTALDAWFRYVDGLDNLDVRDYLNLNLRLGWRLTDALGFDFVGQNLLDNAHREFGEPGNAGLTEVDRSFYARLVWRP